MTSIIYLKEKENKAELIAGIVVDMIGTAVVISMYE